MNHCALPIKILITIALCFINSASLSTQLNDLYATRINVLTQDENERKIAAKTALEQVLIRISGNPDVGVNPVINEALNNSNRYYSQFSYQSTPVDAQNPLPYFLDINFSDNTVNNLLRTAGLPIWGTNRPSVLVWLAIENNQGLRTLVSSSNNQYSDLFEYSQLRGLPIVLPLMDLEDEVSISSGDVWGLFHEGTTQASLRYQVDAVLLGRVYKNSNNEWIGQWSLKNQEETTLFSSQTPTLAEFLKNGIFFVADRFSSQYAIDSKTTGNQTLSLSIEGIENFQIYITVLDYLKNLTPVRAISVNKVAQNRLILNINADGSLQQLIQVIALNETLTPIDSITLKRDVELEYRYISVEDEIVTN